MGPGTVKSLGADCIEKDPTDEESEALRNLLTNANVNASPKDFKLYGSARTLYHFHVDNVSSY